MQPRILLVNTGIQSVPPERGGAIELHTYYLANELALLGIEVHYVTGITQKASFVPGVALHRLPSLPFSFQGAFPETMASYAAGGILAALKALGAIKKHHFCIVHGHGNLSSRIVFQLVRGSKCIFTVHNPTPWMLVSPSLRQPIRTISFKSLDLTIMRRADCVVAVSRYLKREIVSRFGIAPEKVLVIPNGVDTERFKSFTPNSLMIRNKYGIHEQYALFVGRLVEQKGVSYMIQAIQGTDLHIVIVGGGPLLSYLGNRSRQLGVDKQVHFVGAIPSEELPKFYSEASVLVIPSLAEGLPLVGLEAMSSGLPLIGSRVPGVDEIICDGHNGFLVNSGEVTDIRRRLVQLFEDDSLRRKMGTCSREIAEREYSWGNIAKRTLDVYKKLVS